MPHSRRQRRLQQVVVLGHPARLSGKGGLPETTLPVCPAAPEHWAGDYRLARTHEARTFPSLFVSFCSARILWAMHRAIVIRAAGSAPHPSRAHPVPGGW